ncbi:uncharacterized protein LOC100742790 isoform X1 [Bombus impatiens]|uniref:Uncharacterized protein LOC100742790 isoform X1 n=1 Tax=Bombus impatiens TaxID=132113 RepID=A0A6P8L6W7_BOMIM|nr:uncharacterized protein LOC100742790 isoform X1 [Bombus impatiens]
MCNITARFRHHLLPVPCSVVPLINSKLIHERRRTTIVVAYIQRCMIIFAILLCYFHVRSERSESVNCEAFPYHQMCRGSMSRKRAMFPIMYGLGCEGSEGNINCIKEFEERHRIPYIPLSKSKLLIALLDDDLQKDITRSARHKLRNDEMNKRKPSIIENFLSELDSSDNY